jgi:hypothetical protein
LPNFNNTFSTALKERPYKWEDCQGEADQQKLWGNIRIDL